VQRNWTLALNRPRLCLTDQQAADNLTTGNHAVAGDLNAVAESHTVPDKSLECPQMHPLEVHDVDPIVDDDNGIDSADEIPGLSVDTFLDGHEVELPGTMRFPQRKLPFVVPEISVEKIGVGLW
jgi:hypothetical protein